MLCIAGLVRARIALYAYIWFALMRPDYLAFAPGRYNLSLGLAVVALVGAARSLGQIYRLLSPLPILLILLHIPAIISTQYAFFTDYSFGVYKQFFRVCLMAIIIPIMVTKVSHMRLLFAVTAFSLGFMGAWYGIGGPLRGATRMSGGIGGFMSENNTLALGMAMTMPFIWQARALFKEKWIKTAFVLMCIGSVMTTVLTFSRGGAMAMAAAILLLVLYSKKRFFMLALLIAALVPLALVVGPQYANRLSTITDYEEDSSAMSRFVQMEVAYKLWKQHPWFGVGIGDANYIELARPLIPYGELGAGENVIVHNSFLQVLVHEGAIAFVIFVSMHVYALFYSWKAQRLLQKANREEAMYPRAMFISLVAYTIGSMTHPRAGFDFYYMVLMYIAAWHAIAKWEILPTLAAASTPAAASQSMESHDRAKAAVLAARAADPSAARLNRR